MSKESTSVPAAMSGLLEMTVRLWLAALIGLALAYNSLVLWVSHHTRTKTVSEPWRKKLYEVDLVGGPEDGHTYELPNLPPYLYFPMVTVPRVWSSDHTFPEAPTQHAVYKLVINNIYWFEGIQ